MLPKDQINLSSIKLRKATLNNDNFYFIIDEDIIKQIIINNDIELFNYLFDQNKFIDLKLLQKIVINNSLYLNDDLISIIIKLIKKICNNPHLQSNKDRMLPFIVVYGNIELFEYYLEIHKYCGRYNIENLDRILETNYLKIKNIKLFQYLTNNYIINFNLYDLFLLIKDKKTEQFKIILNNISRLDISIKMSEEHKEILDDINKGMINLAKKYNIYNECENIFNEFINEDNINDIENKINLDNIYMYKGKDITYNVNLNDNEKLELYYNNIYLVNILFDNELKFKYDIYKKKILCYDDTVINIDYQYINTISKFKIFNLILKNSFIYINLEYFIIDIIKDDNYELYDYIKSNNIYNIDKKIIYIYENKKRKNKVAAEENILKKINNLEIIKKDKYQNNKIINKIITDFDFKFMLNYCHDNKTHFLEFIDFNSKKKKFNFIIFKKIFNKIEDVVYYNLKTSLYLVKPVNLHNLVCDIQCNKYLESLLDDESNIFNNFYKHKMSYNNLFKLKYMVDESYHRCIKPYFIIDYTDINNIEIFKFLLNYSEKYSNYEYLYNILINTEYDIDYCKNLINNKELLEYLLILYNNNSREFNINNINYIQYYIKIIKIILENNIMNSNNESLYKIFKKDNNINILNIIINSLKLYISDNSNNNDDNKIDNLINIYIMDILEYDDVNSLSSIINNDNNNIEFLINYIYTNKINLVEQYKNSECIKYLSSICNLKVNFYIIDSCPVCLSNIENTSNISFLYNIYCGHGICNNCYENHKKNINNCVTCKCKNVKFINK